MSTKYGMRGLFLTATVAALIYSSHSIAALTHFPATRQLTLHDSARQRDIPVAIYEAESSSTRCTNHRGRVAVVSNGYGVEYRQYSFLARVLSENGYLVVAVQHDLPEDVPLAIDGDLYALRAPVWTRGAENIRFVRNTLSKSYANYDWNRILLVGHSNGGDISMWLAGESPEMISAVITLDHRRVPIPQSGAFTVLSLRSSDMPPIPGVVPEKAEQEKLNAYIVQLANARHNDMYDGGTEELKSEIATQIASFLSTMASVNLNRPANHSNSSCGERARVE